ncbi:uncharacterized protein BDR25DRAFT_356482 [Lindgomyces ingoldianus]|uniref:Uncharacterized protein n=1 Tax=Lindgomyces ingoldianus TaxID=673940 RepID=A0ACB6QQU5_9PLEO|nr:uncharacterized protein BDR25DRAFT_356482 [Lindgomyces ingoldianus]KAF2469232.1 hypothetical protein BDR25DRAFT_356482 [Lindgomyces ingoldianus]
MKVEYGSGASGAARFMTRSWPFNHISENQRVQPVPNATLTPVVVSRGDTLITRLNIAIHKMNTNGPEPSSHESSQPECNSSTLASSVSNMCAGGSHALSRLNRTNYNAVASEVTFLEPSTEHSSSVAQQRKTSSSIDPPEGIAHEISSMLQSKPCIFNPLPQNSLHSYYQILLLESVKTTVNEAREEELDGLESYSCCIGEPGCFSQASSPKTTLGSSIIENFDLPEGYTMNEGLSGELPLTFSLDLKASHLIDDAVRLSSFNLPWTNSIFKVPPLR